MFRTDTRTISKKGGFTIPVQIRRALGIYDKTQVDIVESEDPDVLMLVKSRPHCICCGKVGNSLIKVNRDSVNPINSRYVCAECIDSLNAALANGETIGHELTTSDVIDNYNINLHKIYVNNAEIKTSDVPPITISKDDFKDGKYIKQLNAPKVYGITKEALSTLKCEFRLAKENSEAVSIDSKTGKTVKNNTKGNISVSPEGTLTIKSTEKETYVVECIITADHYKTLAKSIYIYVE